jgi:hypothetical protein
VHEISNTHCNKLSASGNRRAAAADDGDGGLAGGLAPTCQLSAAPGPTRDVAGARHARAQDPAALQLQKDGAVLEDAKKLADLKVENDDVVAMCYKNEGERGKTQEMQGLGTGAPPAG